MSSNPTRKSTPDKGMTTVIKLELSDELRRALHVQLMGKPGLATRAQIQGWAIGTLNAKLAKPNGGTTEMRNMVCPKCSRPIAVAVPAGGPDRRRDEKLAKASDKAKASVADLVAALTQLKEVLP